MLLGCAADAKVAWDASRARRGDCEQRLKSCEEAVKDAMYAYYECEINNDGSNTGVEAAKKLCDETTAARDGAKADRDKSVAACATAKTTWRVMRKALRMQKSR
jgi:hypothetical protein